MTHDEILNMELEANRLLKSGRIEVNAVGAELAKACAIYRLAQVFDRVADMIAVKI